MERRKVDIISEVKQMGREIRRVPKNWEHPRDSSGKYIPLYDQTYKEAAEEWIDKFKRWEKEPDTNEDKKRYPYYWDWYGNPPDKESYRPEFIKEPTHYQIYENISEGTPISPVFETKEEMKRWIISQGYTKEAADKFIEYGYAFSMIIKHDSKGTTIKENIESCSSFKEEENESTRD